MSLTAPPASGISRALFRRGGWRGDVSTQGERAAPPSWRGGLRENHHLGAWEREGRLLLARAWQGIVGSGHDEPDGAGVSPPPWHTVICRLSGKTVAATDAFTSWFGPRGGVASDEHAGAPEELKRNLDS